MTKRFCLLSPATIPRRRAGDGDRARCWPIHPRSKRNPPISCCATGWRPIPPIRTSRPTSRARRMLRLRISPPRSNIAETPAIPRAGRCTNLGRAYAANRQMPEAMAAWRKAADKGSTSAMVELGVLYGTGAGVAKDEGQARKLFERAAQAGNPRGVSNLAALSGGGGAPAGSRPGARAAGKGCRDQSRSAISARA